MKRSHAQRDPVPGETATWTRILIVAALGVAFVGAGHWGVANWRAVRDPAAAAKAPGRDDSARRAATAVRGSAPAFSVGIAETEDRPRSPGRASSRGHRRGRGRYDLEVAPRDRMGAVLVAALVEANPRIEQCLREARARSSGGPADPAVALIRALDTSALSEEERASLRDLQAAVVAGPTAGPRSIVLDVETSDGEMRIVDAPSGTDGSAFTICAQQELQGRSFPLPGAKPARHISVTLPIRPASEPSVSEWELAPEPPQALQLETP